MFCLGATMEDRSYGVIQEDILHAAIGYLFEKYKLINDDVYLQRIHKVVVSAERKGIDVREERSKLTKLVKERNETEDLHD